MRITQKIQSNGRVSIPKPIRDAYGLEAGEDFVELEVKGPAEVDKE